MSKNFYDFQSKILDDCAASATVIVGLLILPIPPKPYTCLRGLVTFFNSISGFLIYDPTGLVESYISYS